MRSRSRDNAGPGWHPSLLIFARSSTMSSGRASASPSLAQNARSPRVKLRSVSGRVKDGDSLTVT